MTNEIKRKRRMEMGDQDPSGAQTVSTDTTSGIPAQPMPGMPQGRGNISNFTAVDTDGQMGQLMGVGRNVLPYGDGIIDDGRMGGLNFVQNSGQNQNIVSAGRGLNQQAYGTVPQAKEGMSQEMLLPQGLAKEAITRAGKLYAYSMDQTPSYIAGPMGMHAVSIDSAMQGNVNTGQFPLQQSQQSGMSLPLTSNTTASVQQSGMNTNRGGGRNQKPNIV